MRLLLILFLLAVLSSISFAQIKSHYRHRVQKLRFHRRALFCPIQILGFPPEPIPANPARGMQDGIENRRGRFR